MSGAAVPATRSLQLNCPKQAVIRNGRKEVTSVYTDGSEIVEHFDVVTDELLLRKVRRPTAVGGEGTWTVEVGSEPRASNPDRDLIVESSSAPALTRQDTKDEYVFRIRNLPYSKDVFSVGVDLGRSDAPSGAIVVRTSNKKYFKVLTIPDLQRAQISLDPSLLSWEVKFETLIIRYKKPLAMCVVDAQERKERAAMPAARVKDGGDAKCDQQ